MVDTSEPAYLWHISLHTGRRTRAPRHMTAQGAVDAAATRISAALDAPGKHVAVAGLGDCALTAATAGGALLVTMWVQIQGFEAPLVTFAVVARSRDSARMWRLLHEQERPADYPLATDPERPADAPWCAVRDEVGLGFARHLAPALAELELASAWAWMERA